MGTAPPRLTATPLFSRAPRPGEYINGNPKWIKVITPGGAVHHLNWTMPYKALQDAAQIPPEG